MTLYIKDVVSLDYQRGFVMSQGARSRCQVKAMGSGICIAKPLHRLIEENFVVEVFMGR